MENIERRWNIKLSYEESRAKLVNRLKIILPDVQVYDGEEQILAYRLGMPVDRVSMYGQYDSAVYIESSDLIADTRSDFELAATIEALLSTVPSFSDRGKAVAELVNSAGVGIVMKSTGKKWVTYPSGEKTLDEEVVNRPLSFLNGGALSEYTKALEHYSEGKWEESAEKTRRALEEYLRQKTSTTKGLEQLIALVASKLKQQPKIPPHLRNTINNVLRALDTNYNESSKHNSKTYGTVEAEFLIYQTGLLMRVLDQIKL